MKRLKSIASFEIIDNSLNYDNMDNELVEILFDSQGVKFKLTGKINVDFKGNDARIDNINYYNYLIDLIKNDKGFNEQINNYIVSNNPEYQLPTTMKVNAWYMPKNIKIIDASVDAVNIVNYDYLVSFSFTAESDITNYSELGKEAEEFETYGINVTDFNFSEEIMTKEFYR